MSDTLLYACGILSLASFLLSLALTPLARRLANRTGHLDQPDNRKRHSSPIPYGGGAAIFFSFALVLGGAYLAVILDFATQSIPHLQEELQPYIAGLTCMQTVYRFGALMAGAAAIFILGMIDDLRKLNPGPKLLVEAAVAVLLYASGIRVTFFIAHWLPGLVLTVIWVVGITNAFNLLDNMDGLAAGVSLIATFVFFAIALQTGQIFVPAVLAVLAGAILGFLRYNFHPASIFMGDAGSLFIGYMLAALSIAGTYYSGRGTILAAAMPVVVLAIPIFDTLSVLAIRYRAGASLLQGDRNHFSHRLMRLGMSVREAVLTIYVLSAALGLTATLMAQLDDSGAMVILLHTVAILMVVALLEIAAARRRTP